MIDPSLHRRRRVLKSHDADARRRREGLVVDEVLSEFENGAHDVLVIGAREEAGWGRDDVTERLLLRCPGSTLVVPR